jgi:phosphocarrier protein HPr
VKLVEKVKVRNRLGLHTRPATGVVQLLQGCKCDVTFTHGQETINAKSLLSILMLAATENTVITVTMDGEKAEVEATMARLKKGFETRFGED